LRFYSYLINLLVFSISRESPRPEMPNSSREIRFLVFLLPAEKSWGEKRHEKQWRVETDGEEIQDENAARFSRESGPDEASEAKGTNLGRTFDFYLPNPHLRSLLLRAIPSADDNFFEKLILSAAANFVRRKERRIAST
jgi:hypothetical protein